MLLKTSRKIQTSKNSAKKLTRQEMTDYYNVRNHLDEFFDTVDQLSKIRIEINWGLLTIVLSYSIPARFENFHSVIESRGCLPTLSSSFSRKIT